MDKSGAWYSYGDDRIGQGRENVKTFLKENPDTLAAIRSKIVENRSPRVNAGNEPSSDLETGEVEQYEEF